MWKLLLVEFGAEDEHGNYLGGAVEGTIGT